MYRGCVPSRSDDRQRSSLLARLLSRFKSRPHREPQGGPSDAPPDIGVREPRRPRRPGPGGAAVLDPPTDRT